MRILITTMAIIALASTALAQTDAKPAYTGPVNAPAQRQGGDTVEDAIPIPNLLFSTTGTTTGYTDDYDEACPYTGSTSPDVVYVYEANQGSSLCQYAAIDLYGSSYDTKVYIYDSQMVLKACNDDFYPDYTSMIEMAEFFSGETYYIVWDDTWEAAGFDWELTLNEGDLPVGDFCESAEAVDPGTYTVEEFGEASVGGYRPGYFTTSTTPYSGGAWYSFTPDSDGTMSINSCGTDADTWLFVYTGDCGLQSLELIAESDDDCIIASSVEDIEVTAGTTYYIEWIDRNDAAGFDWELIFNPPTVNVQMAVDVSLLVEAGELSPDGVFLAGSFSDFNNVEMSDLDGDNIYTVTVQIPENSTATYKFKNGPDGWENIDTSIGDDCTTGEFNDRFVETGTMNIPLDPVCFGYCVSCQTVDVSDVALEQGVSVFPNPAKDVLNVQIDLPEVASRLNIRLVNALGQVVLSRDLGTLQSDNIELDVRNLAAGTYMLQVVDGQAQFTQSVIIK